MRFKKTQGLSSTTGLWVVLLLSIGAILLIFVFNQVGTPSAVVRSSDPDGQTALGRYGILPPFSLINQEGQPFGIEALRGKVWVANFMFTSCAGICPEMSRKMASLQRKLNSQIQLVSISVDPKRDSPPVLKAYGSKYGANFKRWHFLTGKLSTITRLTQEGFGLALSEGEDPKEPIIHSVRFVLVDGNGQIRGSYDSNEPARLKALVREAEILRRSS